MHFGGRSKAVRTPSSSKGGWAKQNIWLIDRAAFVVTDSSALLIVGTYLGNLIRPIIYWFMTDHLKT